MDWCERHNLTRAKKAVTTKTTGATDAETETEQGTHSLDTVQTTHTVTEAEHTPRRTAHT